MSEYTEKTIAFEAVKAVQEYGELSMSDLIAILIQRMQPTGHDMDIMANRNDTYFSQKVRNLRSHKNEIFFSNVYYDKAIDRYVSYEFRQMKVSLDNRTYAAKLTQKKNNATLFYARKLDYESINKERMLIGNAGEEFVYKDQIEYVKEHAPEYVDSVRHVSKLDGDGAGYDIRSFNGEKRLAYIEVKSTTGKRETPFYMSSSEYAFFELHKENYIIARVYEFDISTKTGKIDYVAGTDFDGVFDKKAYEYKITYQK